MARWVLSLQEYEPSNIEYRRGITNSNANALSRLPVEQVEDFGAVMAINEEICNVSSDSNHSDNKVEDTDLEINIGLKKQVDEVWGEVYAVL